MNLGQRVIYQIYPRSFQDSNGDGFGDLQGVIQRLDYLADLGVDMIWLSPFYPSPQNDNGYDVQDYCAVDPKFGTMADFDQLVTQAKERGMEIMLDMVFNHTSTEHEWFQKALAGDPYYQDYYYLRPLKADGSLPTNWHSKFGGPAWERFGQTDQYYLHLYDRTQADLNWHNPQVRQEIYRIINFWLDKGVKGFRFDVLNVIGKPTDLVDSQTPGSLEERALYTDQPIVHEWIKEMNQATFAKDPTFITVGEMSSTSVPAGVQYTNPQEQELSMIFSFHHLKVDYAEGEKWSNPPVDFLKFKRIIDEWQVGMTQGQGWNALFLNNHDQPRATSRFGNPDQYPYETATLLATTIQFLRGTPYLYQGEEIGMTNPNFTSIHDYQDVETKNYYQLMLADGLSEEEALAIIQAKSRDNSRTPMQWNDQVHAGFTQGQPWIAVASNYPQVNVAREREEDHIFAYYQTLIRLRKALLAIQEGSYRGLLLDHPSIMAYVRELETDQGLDQLLVLGHFGEGRLEVDLPEEFQGRKAEKLIGNGASPATYQGQNQLILDAFETVVYRFS